MCSNWSLDGYCGCGFCAKFMGVMDFAHAWRKIRTACFSRRCWGMGSLNPTGGWWEGLWVFCEESTPPPRFSVRNPVPPE